MLSEDIVNGKLNDIRFKKLSDNYETEQVDLENKLEYWQRNLPDRNSTKMMQRGLSASAGSYPFDGTHTGYVCALCSK